MTGMVFNSISYTICGTIFLGLVAIIYLSKRKFNNFENRLYRSLIAMNFFILILEFLFVFSAANLFLGSYTNLIARFYIFFDIIWATILGVYIYAISQRDLINSKPKRYKWPVLIGALFFGIILFVISCFFPITFIGGNNSLYVIGGKATNIVLLVAAVVMMIILVALLFDKKNLTNKQKFPFMFVFLLMVLSTGFQKWLKYDFNDLSMIFALAMLCLYFTIESQDNMLIKELESKKTIAETASNNKSEFLTNMSQAIRTPMSTVIGLSEALIRDKSLDEETLKEDAKSIFDDCVALRTLMSNMIDVTNLESDENEIKNDSYFLQNIITKVYDEILPKTNEKNLDFSINVSEKVPEGFYGDANIFYKILVLIINNAVHYTQFGEVGVNINGEVLGNEFLFNITITNTGHAMSDELFEKDYSDFIKFGSNYSNNIESNIIGLGIAKKLISLLNGSIIFKNEKGHGTKYFVDFKQNIEK